MQRAVRIICGLAAGAAFFTLWYWLLPRWLGFSVQMAGTARWRWLAAIPSVLGFSVALQCVWDFARTGRGSPAPFAPPRRLVVVGYYRHVRNPIYVGAAAGWIGLWIVFGHASPESIAAAALAALGVHLFVVLYEELTLRGKFGGQYEEYCRNASLVATRQRLEQVVVSHEPLFVENEVRSISYRAENQTCSRSQASHRMTAA